MSNAPEAALSAGLDQVNARVREVFAAKHAAREAALSRCREVIRHASMAIRAIHREERETADGLVGQGRALLEEVRAACAGQPDIYAAGFVHDAQKEYAEAALTVAIIAGEALPSPEALGVEYAAYLNGLAEVVGELRRYLLNGLRHNDLTRSERLLAAMDDIYALLVTVDYPDAITGGLRRTTDVTRGILEKTRGDLTVAAQQRQLAERLPELRVRLDA